MTVKTMRMLIVLWVAAVIALAAVALLLAGCQPWPGPVMQGEPVEMINVANFKSQWMSEDCSQFHKPSGRVNFTAYARSFNDNYFAKLKEPEITEAKWVFRDGE